MTQASESSRLPPGRAAAPAESAGRTASRRDTARFFFKHRVTLAGVFALVVGSATLLVYLLPQTYAASARVLVEYGKSPTLRSDPLRTMPDQSDVVTSEIEIIRSRAVAEAVVDRLDLVNRPVADTLARRCKRATARLLDGLGLVNELEPRERLIRSVQRTLEVKQAPKASVLLIRYYADSPEHAAEVARAATDAYIDRHRGIFTDNTAPFFEQRVRETAKELAERRAALERETARQKIDDLQLQLRALEASYLFNQDRLDRARADMAADSSLVNIRVVDQPAIPARPVFSRLLLIALAIAGGAVLAVCCALLAEYFDHRVYTPDDLRARVDAPVLGSVRRARGLDLRSLAEGLR